MVDYTVVLVRKNEIFKKDGSLFAPLPYILAMRYDIRPAGADVPKDLTEEHLVVYSDDIEQLFRGRWILPRFSVSDEKKLADIRDAVRDACMGTVSFYLRKTA